MNRGQTKQNGMGAKQTERGQELMMWAVGMAGKGWQATKSLLNRHCRRTQPADSPSGTGLRKKTAHSWPALQQTTAADDVLHLSPCSKWGGVQRCWQP